MTRLLIAGWRGVSHSIAMANQHQILALARHGGFKLHHVDMPWFFQHWNTRDHASGFAPQDEALIMGLTPLAEKDADCVYRICSPLYTPSPDARRTVSFAITELGFQPDNLKDPQATPDQITAGDNLLVTSSRWSRDRLVDFGFREDKVRVAPLGVDLRTCYPLQTTERANQRAALGIPVDAVVFLNVGVPTWNKGIDLLIRGVALAHQTQPNIRLILKDARALYGLPVDTVLQQVAQAEPGLFTPDLLSKILVISQNLSQAELRLLYGIADHYVSPYRAEGFNLPVLEAQACGTPVIVSSGGSTDDFCHGTSTCKIATVFHRGHLRGERESCWVEPDFNHFTTLLHEAALAGPLNTEAPARLATRKHAELHDWDHATAPLIPLLQA